MKFTVHLPKTSFPMKADLPAREPAFLSFWEKHDVYRRRLEKNKSAQKRFVLHDGPPYANGPIHMGHALNKILKDMVVKFKAGQGFESPYVPGWDCHGLPIEHQLMKEKNWDKRKVGRVPFRQEAARYAEHFVDVQRQQFKRLGILGEWDRPYKTLNPDYEAALAAGFFELLQKGFIERDKKPVYWCGSCETALADAEVEYQDKTSDSIFVKFPLESWPQNPDAQRLAKAAGHHRVSVLVWTTTPWTLPANVALAFHPEQTYSLVPLPGQKEIALVGGPGLEVLGRKFPEVGADQRKPLEAIEGLHLEGLLAKNPLNNNVSQGVLADFVSSEEGTGVVHIAPGHGQEDYAVGRTYGLPVVSPVDEQGRFTRDVLPHSLAGRSLGEANAAVMDLLEKSRHLFESRKITHSYPHCWRCKNPVFFRAAEQWFLRVRDAFRQELLGSLDKVRWVPDYGKDRMAGMLENRPDWCLSRQRFWGIPIPLFYCQGCGEVLRDEKVFAHVVSLLRQKGGNVWYEKDPDALLPPGAKCGKCSKTLFRKEEDILDVWFDSGLSWKAVLRERLQVSDRREVLYLEGSDQHRGWFQTSLLPAVALTGEPPYAEVLTHGFVVDGEGRKMSKSLGNVISPQEVVEKFGADVLRLWVAVSDYREDIRLSQKILDHVVDTYRKIRNTLRFLLGNLADFDPARDAVAYEQMEEIDRAALDSFRAVLKNVREYFEAYEFHRVTMEVCDLFCITVLSGYYLDVQKDVLYCDERNSSRRRSCQTALRIMAVGLARALAPVLSFTAEEVWQALREQKLLDASDTDESVFLNPFPDTQGFPSSPVSMASLRALKTLINEAIEKARQTGVVKGANDAEVWVALGTDAGKDLADLASRGAWPAGKWAQVMGVAGLRVSGSGKTQSEVTAVQKAPGRKCERCWIWREDAGQDPSFPNLCGRCAAAEQAISTAPRPA
jgi:isoleucyl-tRNA synthetase